MDIQIKRRFNENELPDMQSVVADAEKKLRRVFPSEKRCL